MYKVLLVDDEILVREAISENIKWGELGFELASVCENGKDAMDYLKENPVDVVLTDICMPYADGMDLSKYVYNHCPQTSVIIFSGYSDFEYAKQAIQYKVAEYILKPVTARELSEVLLKMKEKLNVERKEEQKYDKFKKAYYSYTKNESLIISKTLSRLVKGTQQIEKSLDELSELNVSIEGDWYRVVAVDIDVYSDLYEIDDDLKKESALMSFVVENISNEIMKNHSAGLAYRDSDNRVCMLFSVSKARKLRAEALQICKEIQETVYETMKLSISIGIGKIVSSLEDLSKSYQSAVELLTYRYTKGCGVLLDGEVEIAAGNSTILEKEFKKIAESLKEQDEAKLEDALSCVERWMVEGYNSRNVVVAYLHQALRIVSDAVREVDDQYQLKEESLSAITNAKRFDEAMNFFKEHCKQAMKIISGAGKTTSQQQAELAMEYIEDNYGDPNLNLNQICEYLNISTSRFSSIFKEATGKTFVEVLTSVRMERAKSLLRKTSLKNYEIAEKVGFSDPHYFSIAFKKMTGKTPKEYARNIE